QDWFDDGNPSYEQQREHERKLINAPLADLIVVASWHDRPQVVRRAIRRRSGVPSHPSQAQGEDPCAVSSSCAKHQSRHRAPRGSAGNSSAPASPRAAQDDGSILLLACLPAAGALLGLSGLFNRNRRSRLTSVLQNVDSA